MTKPEVVRLIFEAAEPLCGHCRHYKAFEEGAGYCKHSPPTWAIDPQGDEISGWPSVAGDDGACGQFACAQ